MRYLDKTPSLDKSVKNIGGQIIGDTTMGPESNVWFHATIRGDMAPIKIGKGTNVQDNAVIHTDTNLPTTIGDYVTIGHSAIVHACTVEDHALIGMGSIILNGAKIGKHAMVAAGCLVPPGKVVPERTLVMGSPMKIIRELTDEEIQANRENADHYIKLSKAYSEDK
jgi:carbonic anhydrase/acetyltransferase-like protein (isoleucine patch superfamily)